MTEINNPKEFCNGSQSGTQQLPPNLCNCTPNIIAGPNIALTPNEDGSVTISATVTDTDTRLGNPHTCAGAPAGYTRFCYDLINVISGATISADFTYVDVPNSTVQTLSVTGDQLSISGGNTITLPSDAVTGQATGHIIATHTAVNGTAFDIKETITTISGNDYINEAGASQAIVQSVSNAINATGGLTTTVNGVAGAVLDLCPAVKHCETDTTIDSIILNGTTLEIRYTGEDGVQQLQTVSLASLAIDINVTSLTYNPVTGEITLVETDGTNHVIDIGPLVVTASGLAVATSTPTGVDISVSCEDVQDCVGTMFADTGFIYDDGANKLTTGGTTGQVLQSNGAGVATWVTPAAAAQTPVTPLDSTNIDVTATGTDNHTVGASIIFDPNVLNVAKDTGTGLLVDVNEIALAVCASPTDLSCLSLATTGTAAPVIVKEEFFPLSGNTITVANTPTNYFPMQVFLGNGTALLLGEAPGPIEVHPDMTTFPVTGVVGTTYLDQSMNTFYVWDTGTSTYIVTQPVSYTRSGDTLTFAYDFFGGDTVRVWYSY